MTYASRASVLASPRLAPDILFTVRPGTYRTCWPWAPRSASSRPAAVPVMSTAQSTCSARPSTAAIACRIALSSLTTFDDHKVAPASSFRHTQWWPLPTSTPAHPRGTTCSISCSPRTHDYRVARRTPRRQIRKQRPERASQSAVEAPRRTGQPIHRSHQGQSRLSHTRPHRATQQLTDPGSGALVPAHPGQAQRPHRTVHGPRRRAGHRGAPQRRGHLAPPIQPLRGQPAHPVDAGGPHRLAHRVEDHGIGHGPRRDHTAGHLPGPVGPCGDLAALLAQDPADRLDRVALAALDVDETHHQRLRGSRSPAKKPVAAFKIALSSSSRRTAAFSALISASSTLVGLWRCPASTWAWTTHRRTLSPPTPSFLATAAAAAVARKLG